jgi:hypothetical protein
MEPWYPSRSVYLFVPQTAAALSAPRQRFYDGILHEVKVKLLSIFDLTFICSLLPLHPSIILYSASHVN